MRAAALSVMLLATGCLTWSDYPQKTATTSEPDAAMSGDSGVEPGDWWNSDWQERRLIEVPAGAAPAESLGDFPLRVGLTHDGPVRFVALDGEVLPHQRDGDGFWVRVSIEAATATSFYAYTSNPDAVLSDSPEVWSNAYVAVFHFEEELVDETAGFQPYFVDELSGLTVRQEEEFSRSGHTAGQFGNALHLTDSFETRFFSPDLHADFPSGPVTVELWFTIVPLLNSVRNVMSQVDGLAIEMRDPGILVTTRGDQQRSVGWEVQNDVWAKMTIVLDEVSPRRVLRVYLDDAQPRESPPLPESWTPTQSEFFFGARSTLDFRYDELRVSGVARSDAWVRFAARTESDSSPVVVGSVEQHD